jgi:Fe-S oxidoreductase
MNNIDANSDDRRFRPYRTDLGSDFFSLMRQERGFFYADILDASGTHGTSSAVTHDAPRSLFWPGCTLSSYSRDLTEAVFSFLRERGVASCMSVKCCGNIIRYAGGRAAAKAYQDRLASALRENGIGRVISACPNCCRSFRAISSGATPEEAPGDPLSEAPREAPRTAPSKTVIESLSLSEVLADEGLRISPEQSAAMGSACVHDSCPDRRHGVDAAAVRRLLEGVELREMRHNRRESRCCGLGRLQFLSDPASSNRQRRERIGEFKETGAEQLVTYCFSCTNALQDPRANLAAIHYLELLFDIRIDWPAVYKSSQRILATF